MSTSSRHDGKRPTLPPIRDLFRDELSQPPNPSRDSLPFHGSPAFHDSPPLNLARLNVSEDVSERALSRPSSSSSRGQMNRSTYDPSSVYTTTSSIYSCEERDIQYDPRRSTHRIPSNNSPIPHLYGVFPRPRDTLEPKNYHSVEQHIREPTLHRSMSYSHPPHPPRERFHSGYPPHSQSVPYSDYRYNIEHFPRRHAAMSGAAIPLQPWAISTDVYSGRRTEDEERTPVAHYQKATRADNAGPAHADQEEPPGSSSSKYECSYCGKGFNRPSSLKIHLNSHTGEKPFICPVESCGRSFSVLSNMRRHARVHSQMPLQEVEPSVNVEGEGGQSASGMVMGVPHDSFEISESRPKTQPSSAWYRRRDSSASASSSSSRRSRSISSKSDADYDDERPEKRTRHHPK